MLQNLGNFEIYSNSNRSNSSDKLTKRNQLLNLNIDHKYILYDFIIIF